MKSKEENALIKRVNDRIRKMSEEQLKDDTGVFVIALSKFADDSIGMTVGGTMPVDSFRMAIRMMLERDDAFSESLITEVALYVAKVNAEMEKRERDAQMVDRLVDNYLKRNQEEFNKKNRS